MYYTAQGAPPSYNDVMGISQLRKDIGAAKEESNNPAVMLFKICCLCTGSRKYPQCSLVPRPLSFFCVGVGKERVWWIFVCGFV